MSATGGAAAAAAYIAAINASGAIVQVEPNDFLAIVGRQDNPLVVYCPAGFFTQHKYMTSYKGLCFYTKTADPLTLSSHVELISAKKMWMPT